MADLGDIVEELRTREDHNLGHEDPKDQMRQNSAKRKRSRKRRNSGGSQGSAQHPTEGQERDESGIQGARQPANSNKQDPSPDQRSNEARFYEDYRKVAEEYDKEFQKKYDEDLNTTLIFAGLFSAVASAFIIQVDSQLRPDTGDETAALLRILIYQNNKTVFGDNVPTLPKSTAPTPTMVNVQAMLFASLSASLLSAFLAMLGKQWLNRYASTDMRGSAIERSQHRQRKLDGIVRWYFDFVMESLPVMLQIALLLLGCGLSRYLWDTNITIASVVIGFTVFGLLFYLFILVAGTASEECPYQTPGSRIFRYLGPPAVSILGSIFKWFTLCELLCTCWDEPILSLICIGAATPIWFTWDVCRFGWAVIRALSYFPIAARRTVHWARNRLRRMFSTPEQTSDNQPAVLGSSCISWTLQISLEKPVHLSTLRHLVTITKFADFDPAIVVDCFNIFLSCISISNKVVVTQGFEELAALSAKCFYQTFRHLSATRPNSRVAVGVRRSYRRVFGFDADFRGLPFCHTMINTRPLVDRDWKSRHIRWTDYHTSDQELIPFARYMVDAAREEYRRTQNKKVPRWILRFALHFLSRDPPSPTSVIADCLTIISIALDRDPSGVLVLDESLRVEQVSSLITREIETIAEGLGTDQVFRSKHKVISALFPYAVCLAQDGQRGSLDAILHVALKSRSGVSVWYHIARYTTALFDKSSPPFLNQAIILAAPCIKWRDKGTSLGWGAARWASAVLATPYSEEVGQSVVDGLFQILSCETLQPHIPIDIWAWLKRQPPLPYKSEGVWWGSTIGVVSYIRCLGDIEILKTYFLLVWSRWNILEEWRAFGMKVSLREDFCGVAMQHHRKDLIERLGHVLDQLDQKLESLKGADARKYILLGRTQYRTLLDILEEEDRKSMNPTLNPT